MGKYTLIQWADATVNPVMGCNGCELWTEKVESCYAGYLHGTMGKRNKGFATTFEEPKAFRGRAKKAAGYSDLAGLSRPGEPWLDGRRRMIFVSDMGDAFSDGAVDEQGRAFANEQELFLYLFDEVIAAARSPKGRRHDWLWLTKRPAKFAKFTDWMREEFELELPLNVWAGTSITTRNRLPRIDDLRRVGRSNTIRFLSCEPLWEVVSLKGRLEGIKWVIVGGESAQGNVARHFECDWARRIRGECQAAEVAFFLKQLGSNATDGARPLSLEDSHGGNWDEWPTDLKTTTRNFPDSAC